MVFSRSSLVMIPSSCTKYNVCFTVTLCPSTLRSSRIHFTSCFSDYTRFSASLIMCVNNSVVVTFLPSFMFSLFLVFLHQDLQHSAEGTGRNTRRSGLAGREHSNPHQPGWAGQGFRCCPRKKSPHRHRWVSNCIMCLSSICCFLLLLW